MPVTDRALVVLALPNKNAAKDMGIRGTSSTLSQALASSIKRPWSRL